MKRLSLTWNDKPPHRFGQYIDYTDANWFPTQLQPKRKEMSTSIDTLPFISFQIEGSNCTSLSITRWIVLPSWPSSRQFVTFMLRYPANKLSSWNPVPVETSANCHMISWFFNLSFIIFKKEFNSRKTTEAEAVTNGFSVMTFTAEGQSLTSNQFLKAEKYEIKYLKILNIKKNE